MLAPYWNTTRAGSRSRTGSDAGDTKFNLRHAWVEMGGLGFGQTNSTFMDISIFPNHGGRFSFTREQCLGVAARLREPLGDLPRPAALVEGRVALDLEAGDRRVLGQLAAGEPGRQGCRLLLQVLAEDVEVPL